jgi:hypothetical protein
VFRLCVFTKGFKSLNVTPHLVEHGRLLWYCLVDSSLLFFVIALNPSKESLSEHGEMCGTLYHPLSGLCINNSPLHMVLLVTKKVTLSRPCLDVCFTVFHIQKGETRMFFTGELLALPEK